VALDDRVLEVGRSGLKSLSMIDSGHGRRIYRGVVPQKARLRLSLNIPLRHSTMSVTSPGTSVARATGATARLRWD
jgi:hypothetical protein